MRFMFNTSWLWFFMREHVYLGMLLHLENREAWSVFSFFAYASQLPTNIYYLYRSCLVSNATASEHSNSKHCVRSLMRPSLR